MFQCDYLIELIDFFENENYKYDINYLPTVIFHIINYAVIA